MRRKHEFPELQIFLLWWRRVGKGETVSRYAKLVIIVVLLVILLVIIAGFILLVSDKKIYA
jgi:hypothetical protein